MAFSKTERRNKIKRRIRGKISGSAEKPRMSVFRSNKQIFVQLVDDTQGRTLTAASSSVKEIGDIKGTKTEKAAMVGKLIAERALAVGVEKVVFDRNGYLYHGRVKKLADAAREGGLKF
jgi:large subunit ribosomal protein L18